MQYNRKTHEKYSILTLKSIKKSRAYRNHETRTFSKVIKIQTFHIV
jgi:hypothetical protein